MNAHHSSLMLKCALAAAACFSLTIGPVTFAQNGLQLEEVLVTAQKREENLQDIAVSVTVLNANTIDKLGIRTTSDLVRIAPSLTVNQSNNKTNSGFRIRGIGTNVFGIGVEQAVSMIVDDVAWIQQGQSLATLADIERVEVLRGPQSTLFGKAASAGAINITTKAPSEEFESSVELSITDESEQRVQGSLSGPISNSVGFRLSGYWYDHEGWGKNLTEGQKSDVSYENAYGLRGKLKWDISDTVSTTLTAYVSDEESDCCARTIRHLDPNARLFGFVPVPIAEGITPSEENTDIRRDTPANGATEVSGANLRVSVDIGEFKFLSISAYDHWEYQNDEDVDVGDLDVLSIITGGALSGGFFSTSFRDMDYMSQEFRLISPSYDNFDYLVGLFYSDAEIDRTFFRNLPIAPSDWAGTGGTEHIAVFGQLNWNVTDRTRIGFGLRWFDEEISADVANFLPGALPPVSGKAGEADVTGKLSVQHSFADDVMVFASYTRGHKGQAYDIKAEFSPQNALNPVAAESADAFELGLKSSLWDNRMRLNLTLFHTVYDNFQVQSVTFNDQGLAEFNLNNVGELVTNGLELETLTLLTETLTLTLNAAYVDAEVNDYVGADCYEGQTAETGCDLVTDTQTIDGGTLPYTPETKYTVALDYDQPLDTMSFDVFANAIYTWQDDSRFRIDQNPLTVHDSYGVANFSVGIRDKSERYEITAFVNNAFDKNYVGDMLDARFLFGGTPALFHMVPRNSQRYFGLKAKFNF